MRFEIALSNGDKYDTCFRGCDSIEQVRQYLNGALDFILVNGRITVNKNFIISIRLLEG